MKKYNFHINKFSRLRFLSYIVLFGLCLTALHLGNTVSLPPLTGWNRTKTQIVSKDSTLDSGYPSIAIDNMGNIHVVWQDKTNYDNSGTDQDIFYKMFNVTTQSWTTTQVVSTESTATSEFPSLAIDSKNNVHVVWDDATDYSNAGTDYDIFYKMFNTTTQSWTTTQVVSTDSTTTSDFPSLAIDSQNNVHVVWEDLTDTNAAGSDWDIFYKVYSATTQTWSNLKVVSTESTAGSYTPNIAIDSKDNVHVVWYDTTDYGGSGVDGDIFYKMFDSNTKTWGTTIVVSTDSTSDSAKPKIAIDTQNNVHVVWEDYTDYAGSGGADYDIFYKLYSPLTKTWSTTQVVSTESTGYSLDPSLITDSQNNVHVIWQDYTNYAGSGNDADIFYKMYNLTASAWGPTQVVSIESTQPSNHPNIAIDSQDNLHVVWDDTTDYAGAGADADIFYNLLVNLNNLPITVTKTEVSTQVTTQNNTITQTTTQVETSVISTNSNPLPWFILPTLMAFVSVEFVLYRRRRNTYS